MLKVLTWAELDVGFGQDRFISPAILIHPDGRTELGQSSIVIKIKNKK